MSKVLFFIFCVLYGDFATDFTGVFVGVLAGVLIGVLAPDLCGVLVCNFFSLFYFYGGERDLTFLLDRALGPLFLEALRFSSYLLR